LNTDSKQEFYILTTLTVFTMAATKRIPVSEETWKKLGKEKEPGQTWDELLEKMMLEIEKEKLAEKSRKAKEGEMQGKSLDEL
jgi:hypothetical protein